MEAYDWLKKGPIRDPDNPLKGIVEFLDRLQDPDNGLKFLHSDLTPYSEAEMDALRLEKEAKIMRDEGVI